MAIPKSTNREAITYAPNLDVMLRLGRIYVGQPVTLACSGCEEEVYCEFDGAVTLRARLEMHDRIVALFQHTAFEHAVRYDVVRVATTTELVWEA